jgi:molybdopterin molybdotransferase
MYIKNIEQISAELQGYDPQALSADAVGNFLARLVQPLGAGDTPQAATETLPLMQAHHRILAADIVSPLSVPPHDNSAMDGYAFDSRALQALAKDQPLVLRPVGGTAFAGKAWQGEVDTVTRGECVKIMTGAIMPAGLDTVVPQELTQPGPDGTVVVPAGVVQAGDNRRLMGEDLMQGHPALRAGQRLTPAALGLAASLGLPTVTVWRRLKVACFSTGDEILSLGEAPREGAVYDSNRYTVFGLLQRLGCEVLDLGVVRDEPGALEATFRRAAAEADAIITSGGVSVGEADHTKAVMKQLAATDPSGHSGVAFWRIAMRPGRPMAVGRFGRTVLFGLPGNPVAVMVTFLAFVRPALLRMMGCQSCAPVMLKARSLEHLRKKPGRTEYQRGTVSTAADGSLQVHTTGHQGSGVLRSMVEANGLIVLHHHQGSVQVGDEVDVMMFEGALG